MSVLARGVVCEFSRWVDMRAEVGWIDGSLRKVAGAWC